MGVFFRNCFVLRSLFAEYKPIEAEAANAENCDRTDNDADNCACAKTCILGDTDNGILREVVGFKCDCTVLVDGGLAFLVASVGSNINNDNVIILCCKIGSR